MACIKKSIISIVACVIAVGILYYASILSGNHVVHSYQDTYAIPAGGVYSVPMLSPVFTAEFALDGLKGGAMSSYRTALSVEDAKDELTRTFIKDGWAFDAYSGPTFFSFKRGISQVICGVELDAQGTVVTVLKNDGALPRQRS